MAGFLMTVTTEGENAPDKNVIANVMHVKNLISCNYQNEALLKMLIKIIYL